MAKLVDARLKAIAQTFLNRFGFASITIDQFDSFIIDHGLATDPGTTDKKDQRYKGFVQQRSNARNRLNNAGVVLETGFVIDVRDAGKLYSVRHWADSSTDVVKDVANRIKTFTEGRMREFAVLSQRAEALHKENPGDVAIQEVHQLASMVKVNAITLQARVEGMVTQYNSAVRGAEKYINNLLEAYDKADAKALEKLQASNVVALEQLQDADEDAA
ncbi:MAG: hypothetical protein MUD05_07775 [Candidatus Nanopelagicales bacterium]|jgi:hypothetical protein|nr:hypothetical protein [Candidatus Nanopelagicales bacterium]